jgi:hypothetical protein
MIFVAHGVISPVRTGDWPGPDSGLGARRPWPITLSRYPDAHARGGDRANLESQPLVEPYSGGVPRVDDQAGPAVRSTSASSTKAQTVAA